MRLRGFANAITCTFQNLPSGQVQRRTITSTSLGETTTGASLYAAVETATPVATLLRRCASCLSDSLSHAPSDLRRMEMRSKR